MLIIKLFIGFIPIITAQRFLPQSGPNCANTFANELPLFVDNLLKRGMIEPKMLQNQCSSICFRILRYLAEEEAADGLYQLDFWDYSKIRNYCGYPIRCEDYEGIFKKEKINDGTGYDGSLEFGREQRNGGFDKACKDAAITKDKDNMDFLRGTCQDVPGCYFQQFRKHTKPGTAGKLAHGVDEETTIAKDWVCKCDTRQYSVSHHLVKWFEPVNKREITGGKLVIAPPNTTGATQNGDKALLKTAKKGDEVQPCKEGDNQQLFCKCEKEKKDEAAATTQLLSTAGVSLDETESPGDAGDATDGLGGIELDLSTSICAGPGMCNKKNGKCNKLSRTTYLFKFTLDNPKGIYCYPENVMRSPLQINKKLCQTSRFCGLALVDQFERGVEVKCRSCVDLTEMDCKQYSYCEWTLRRCFPIGMGSEQSGAAERKQKLREERKQREKLRKQRKREERNRNKEASIKNKELIQGWIDKKMQDEEWLKRESDEERPENDRWKDWGNMQKLIENLIERDLLVAPTATKMKDVAEYEFKKKAKKLHDDIKMQRAADQAKLLPNYNQPNQQMVGYGAPAVQELGISLLQNELQIQENDDIDDFDTLKNKLYMSLGNEDDEQIEEDKEDTEKSFVSLDETGQEGGPETGADDDNSTGVRKDKRLPPLEEMIDTNDTKPLKRCLLTYGNVVKQKAKDVLTATQRAEDAAINDLKNTGRRTLYLDIATEQFSPALERKSGKECESIFGCEAASSGGHQCKEICDPQAIQCKQQSARCFFNPLLQRCEGPTGDCPEFQFMCLQVIRVKYCKMVVDRYGSDDPSVPMDCFLQEKGMLTKPPQLISNQIFSRVRDSGRAAAQEQSNLIKSRCVAWGPTIPNYGCTTDRVIQVEAISRAKRELHNTLLTECQRLNKIVPKDMVKLPCTIEYDNNGKSDGVDGLMKKIINRQRRIQYHQTRWMEYLITLAEPYQSLSEPLRPDERVIMGGFGHTQAEMFMDMMTGEEFIGSCFDPKELQFWTNDYYSEDGYYLSKDDTVDNKEWPWAPLQIDELKAATRKKSWRPHCLDALADEMMRLLSVGAREIPIMKDHGIDDTGDDDKYSEANAVVDTENVDETSGLSIVHEMIDRLADAFGLQFDQFPYSQILSVKTVAHLLCHLRANALKNTDVKVDSTAETFRGGDVTYKTGTDCARMLVDWADRERIGAELKEKKEAELMGKLKSKEISYKAKQLADRIGQECLTKEFTPEVFHDAVPVEGADPAATDPATDPVATDPESKPEEKEGEAKGGKETSKETTWPPAKSDWEIVQVEEFLKQLLVAHDRIFPFALQNEELHEKIFTLYTYILNTKKYYNIRSHSRALLRCYVNAVYPSVLIDSFVNLVSFLSKVLMHDLILAVGTKTEPQNKPMDPAYWRRLKFKIERRTNQHVPPFSLMWLGFNGRDWTQPEEDTDDIMYGPDQPNNILVKEKINEHNLPAAERGIEKAKSDEGGRSKESGLSGYIERKLPMPRYDLRQLFYFKFNWYSWLSKAQSWPDEILVHSNDWYINKARQNKKVEQAACNYLYNKLYVSEKLPSTGSPEWTLVNNMKQTLGDNVRVQPSAYFPYWKPDSWSGWNDLPHKRCWLPDLLKALKISTLTRHSWGNSIEQWRLRFAKEEQAAEAKEELEDEGYSEGFWIGIFVAAILLLIIIVALGHVMTTPAEPVAAAPPPVA